MICLHLNILNFPQFQFEAPHHQFSKRTCSEFFKDFKEFTSLETAAYFIHSDFSSFLLFWIFYEIYSQDFFLLYRINFYIALMEKSYFQLSVMMLLFHFKDRRSTDYPTEYSAVNWPDLFLFHTSLPEGIRLWNFVLLFGYTTNGLLWLHRRSSDRQMPFILSWNLFSEVYNKIYPKTFYVIIWRQREVMMTRR